MIQRVLQSFGMGWKRVTTTIIHQGIDAVCSCFAVGVSVVERLVSRMGVQRSRRAGSCASQQQVTSLQTIRRFAMMFFLQTDSNVILGIT
jgi:hypothetical protein